MFTIIRAEKQYRNAKIPRRVSFNTLTLSRDIERSGEGCGKKLMGRWLDGEKKNSKLKEKSFHASLFKVSWRFVDGRQQVPPVM